MTINDQFCPAKTWKTSSYLVLSGFSSRESIRFWTLVYCWFPAPVYRKEDWNRKQEAERIKREEAEQKKKEDDAKKAAAKKEKEEKEKKEKEEKLKAEKEKADKEAAEAICPKIECTCIDTLLKPLEDKMDTYLGTTIDPFTGRTLWELKMPSFKYKTLA